MKRVVLVSKYSKSGLNEFDAFELEYASFFLTKKYKLNRKQKIIVNN